MNVSRISAALLLVFLFGCQTHMTSMSNLKPIPIPGDLSEREAVCGVVLATDPTRMPSDWKDMVLIASRFVFVSPYSHTRPVLVRADPLSDARWRVEEVGERFAVLGFTASANKHYIRVKYSIEGGNLVPSVLDANNLRLDREENTMHKNGVEWINRNIPIIREGMWQVKTIKESAADPDADLRVRKAELASPGKAKGTK